MKKLLLMGVLLPISALSDPGVATRYLMSEPASLMDIGMMRAISHFDMADDLIESTYSTSDPTLLFSSAFEYEFEDDLFVLTLTIIISERKKFRCEDLATRYSNILTNLMPMWFAHDSYTSGKEPANYEDELLRRVEVRCNTETSEGRRKLSDGNLFWKDY